ncbi:MAG: glycosyltransferase family 4 protein [Actinomycetota bacterium]|nr:glycosyltransferase family 4 protein [Actinomycetota bacterium]
MGERQTIGMLVEGYPGQRTVAELSRLAAEGVSPRIHYVEVAKAVDGEVLDGPFMETSASPLARTVGRAAGPVAAQVTEAFLRRRRYTTVCAWSDRLGLPLALLHKVARSNHDLVLVSQWLSRPKKALFVTRLGVDSHLRAILNSSTYQIDYAARELRIPENKLHVAHRPVDERFWRTESPSNEDVVCAVGWEARDYGTLLAAVEGLRLDVTVAVGMIGMVAGKQDHRHDDAGSQADQDRLAVLAPWKRTFGYGMQEAWLERVNRDGPPANVTITYQLGARELRELYARSRFVVVPLHDVDSNCGVTTVTEAMSMGRAVIVTRIRGQSDVITHGEQGLYVPAGDAAALRAAIQHLMDHPEEAERMGRAGRALVENRHAMDSYVAQLRSVLEGQTKSSAPLKR